jgi:hypothetical protein
MDRYRVVLLAVQRKTLRFMDGASLEMPQQGRKTALLRPLCAFLFSS